MSNDSVVIVAANRTAMGGFQGSLSEVSAPNLGATAIKATLGNSGLKETDVSEVIMGNVLPAGLGQAPARQAMLYAGLPQSTGATTINKVCGSGLKAAMFATDLIRAGSADVVVAGGMESMSRAPYLLDKGRNGYRMGHGQLFDHMMLDGLEDAYEGKAMGCYAQDTADKYGLDRDAMDNFAWCAIIKRHAIGRWLHCRCD